MPRQPAKSRRDVFINVPFDVQHEYLYLALICSLLALDLTPRSVLEIPPSEDRLRRLVRLIGSCPYSLHDLSCVGLTRTPFRVPRFNMPFELGVAAAIAFTRRTHEFRLLEAVPQRIGQSLSDAAGYDPFIHHGSAAGVFEAVQDAFSTMPVRRRCGAAEFRWLYRRVQDYRRTLGANIYRATPFGRIVLATRLLVGQLPAGRPPSGR